VVGSAPGSATRPNNPLPRNRSHTVAYFLRVAASTQKGLLIFGRKKKRPQLVGRGSWGRLRLCRTRTARSRTARSRMWVLKPTIPIRFGFRRMDLLWNCEWPKRNGGPVPVLPSGQTARI